MADIIVGERVVNKNGESGTIISFEKNFICVQFEKRVASFMIQAFEQGFLKYENANLQNDIDKGIQQAKETKEHEAEAQRIALKKQKDACHMMQEKAPIGVKFNSVSIRLEPTPVSLNSVKNKHRSLIKEIFEECDKDIQDYYNSFNPTMRYITPLYNVTSSHQLRSRYSVGYLSNYLNTYVFRVFSRNDMYIPGMYGGYTVTNSDTTEILRIIYAEGEIYYFSKHLTGIYGVYENTTSYKKWQHSEFARLVTLDKVIRNCECKYLNDYIENAEINCFSYVNLLMSALHNNKAEIVFKNKAISSVSSIDNIVDYLEEFSSKQIDFASKNNVVNALPFIKRYGIFDLQILTRLEAVMQKKRNTNSLYNYLERVFNHLNFDISVLDKELIGFLRRTVHFNVALYRDYVRILVPNPNLTIDDLFDKNYQERHIALLEEERIYIPEATKVKYAEVAMELSWINREENGYYIIVPKSIKELMYEGQSQHNCVYTLEYYEEVINRDSIIVFLRKEKNESFITIEYDYETFSVKQAYGKYNQNPSREMEAYIVDLGERLRREKLAR